jgi:tetratricopeptide (TPR) repeat protein
MADGEKAWEGRTVSLPSGALVAGRGFYAGHDYYVPLSSAEVAAVDLDAGKLGPIAKSRKGNVPGNLVCYKGKVISQGLDSVEAFYQVDAAREEIRQRLAANADDPEALSLRGEMLLDEGKAAEAVASFQRAYQLDADPRTRELLRDALLDGLRNDFAGHRKYAAEIEKLLDDAVQRALFLRLMAAGLQQAGEWRAALDQYLKLVEMDQGQRPLEQVDRSLLVRRDRWFQLRLSALRKEGGHEASAEVDKFVEGRFKAALGTEGVDALRRFLDYFGNQPVAAQARAELIKRLAAGGRLLEAELLLWPDRYGSDRAAAGASLAELAGLFAQAGKHDAAAACYRQLVDAYSDVACRDGKTGKQMLAALPEDGPVRRLLVPPPTWPVGVTEAKRPGGSTNRQVYYGHYSFAVPLQGNAGPFFANNTLRYVQHPRQALAVFDELGREKWQAQLTDGQQNTMGYNQYGTQARIQGHVVLLPMGTKIYALDPQGLAGNNSRVLWVQDLTDSSADSDRPQQRVLINRRGGAMVVNNGVVFTSYGSAGAFRMNSLGPVTSRYVSFLRFHNLVVADPMTGESLWVRQDVPQNSEVFGDEQYIFALPPGQSEAMVLRAQDGELLGKRTIARPKSVQQVGYNGMDRNNNYTLFHQTGMATLGRCVLTWEPGNESVGVMAPGQAIAVPLNPFAPLIRAVTSGTRGAGLPTLKFFDPWEQKDLWPARTFAAGARASLVGEEAIGVFEPNGHFVLVELRTGRTIADVKLQPETSLTDVTLTRLGDQYFLMVQSNKPRQGNPRFGFQAIQGSIYQGVRFGRLYAFDLQGKPSWPAPVTVEDQYFLFNVPAHVPILAFGCMKYDQRGNGAWKTSIACVDRRTGRVFCRESFEQHATALDIVGNPEQKTAEVRLQGATITVAFTDKPLPPAAPGGETTFKPGQGKLTEALWQAVGEPFGNMMEVLAESAEGVANAVQQRWQGAPTPPQKVRNVRPRRIR